MKHSLKSPWLRLLIVFGLFVLALSGMNFLIDPHHSLKDAINFGGMLLITLGATALIPLGILGGMSLLQKAFPNTEADTIPSSVEDAEGYTKINLLTIPLFFFGWAIGCLVSYYCLAWAADAYFKLIQAVYLAPVERIFWGFPALFLGMILAVWFIDATLKLLYKNKYEHYKRVSDTISFTNNARAMKAIFGVFLVGIVVTIYIGLTSYTRFTEEGIYSRHPFRIAEEFHPYDQVIRVEETIRVRKREEDHHFIIQFLDGKSWKTNALKPNDIPEYYDEMMAYVAEKSQQEFIQTVTAPKEQVK